jgi:hypothetical protein
MQFGNQQTIKYSPLINQDSIQGTASENSRGLVKKEIQQAFNQGNLSFRVIDIVAESNYLQQEKKAPRPVYTVAANIPTAMREIRGATIGLIGTVALFSFKCNAATYILEDNNTNLEKCDAKNLPNSKSLLEKQYELASRRWEVYQISTSGHLTADGSFSLPKFKDQIETDYILPHTEDVKSQYTTENIKLSCLSERDHRNIMEILTEKQKLEETLNIKAKLPIGIFSETKGSLSIVFEEDLNLNVLEKNENIIKYCEAIFNSNFRNTLAAVIPLSSKIKILSNKVLTYFDESNLKNLREQVILNNKLENLIKNYTQHEVKELENLIKQGANIHSSVEEFFADQLYLNYLFNCNKKKSQLQFVEMLECLLVNNGDFSFYSIYSDMIHGKHRNKELFFDLCVAAYSVLDNVSSNVKISLEQLTLMLLLFDKSNLSCTALSDTILRKQSIQDLKKIIALSINKDIKDNREVSKEKYTAFVMILFHYGITKKEIIEIKQEIININAILYNNKSVDMVLDEYIALWESREQNSIYNSWPEQVQQAQQQIQPIKDRLLAKYNANTTTINKNSIDNNKIIEDVLLGIFNNKLILQQEINSNDETIATILDHYYRRPGINQIRNTIINRYGPPEAQIWKKIHSSSHVLRACNNATWYIELLEKFNLAVFTDEEKILLQLAVIYHDAAAEDASKQEEEQKAAYYFKRDLQGKFPSSLLTKVALALETKEDDRHGIEQQHEDIDKYTAIIRFADRMDFIRCSTVNNNFPTFNDKTVNNFNTNLLNLPQQEQIKFSSNNSEKTLFQRHLEAAMHGAVDLAEVAGGYHSKEQDLRTKGSYDSRYNLAIDNQRIKFSFEHTDKPVSQLNEAIDNNVRRKIAQLAGINTCIDPQHNVCKADTINGISRGIHSTWNDLSQITVPKTMSLLEKMQIEHDFSLLSQATQEAINLEVARLKTEGIQMSLGTLTQNTLKSDAAKATLKKRGITVISEQRARGFNNLNEQVYYEMLVPKSGSLNFI